MLLEAFARAAGWCPPPALPRRGRAAARRARGPGAAARRGGAGALPRRVAGRARSAGGGRPVRAFLGPRGALALAARGDARGPGGGHDGRRRQAARRWRTASPDAWSRPGTRWRWRRPWPTWRRTARAGPRSAAARAALGGAVHGGAHGARDRGAVPGDPRGPALESRRRCRCSTSVTGGAGFIGSNTVGRLLERGERVRVLDNFATGKRHYLFPLQDRVELIEGDIRYLNVVREATRDVDYVIHMAALPSVPRSIRTPIESNDVNVSGTLNVLIAARDLGGEARRLRRLVVRLRRQPRCCPSREDMAAHAARRPTR
ncbi:MAG: GDP-mannose 4,6-dehydratase [Marinilabiliales bacterium]|nr:GDP-mannose 4,6-dehydratase [Marinilabiliales bacterium]